MALIQCKECGNEISSKAETCPKCGLRLTSDPKTNSGRGCFVGLFKLFGGLIGAVIALIYVQSLFSNSDSVTPALKLETSCEELSRAMPEGDGRRAAYESCIASGSSVIGGRERQTATTALNTSERSQVVAPDSAKGAALEVKTVQFPAQEQRPAACYKGVKFLEQASISGILETSPMGGPRTVLKSTTLGTVLMDVTWDPYLHEIEENQRKVVVSGTIQNYCTSDQIRAAKKENQFNCMWSFDLSKPISIRPLTATEAPSDKFVAIPIPQEPIATRTAPMNSRFSINGMEISDKQTNLIWRRCFEGQSWDGNTCSGEAKIFSHSDADDYAANEPKANGLPWRVPTKEELLSLVVKTRQCPAMDVAAFGENAGVRVLHKATGVTTGQSNSAVDFAKGEAKQVFGDGVLLRLVRNQQ